MRFYGKAYDTSFFRIVLGVMLVVLGLIFIIVSSMFYSLSVVAMVYMMVTGAITVFVGTGFLTSSRVKR